MIGFYNYTVILTFLSALSGTAGSILCLMGIIPPHVGMFFLMFSAVCDSFDGTVARTRKGRTRREQCFGVQIDSLADLVSFGVLPACLGMANLPKAAGAEAASPVWLWAGLALSLAFMLAALIRLAFFNTLEEERSRTNADDRKCYVGLPTTCVALIFPAVLILQSLSGTNLSWLYLAALLAVSYLFVCRLEIPKPGIRGVLALMGLGLVEFVALVALYC